MNRPLARLLVTLHGRSWRDRFGAECYALLEELPAAPAVLASMAGSIVVSRGPLLVRGATAALIAVLLAVSASLAFPRDSAGGIAARPLSPASARPN